MKAGVRRLSHPAVIVLRLAALVALAFSSATVVDYYGPSQTFCDAGGGCEVVRYFAYSTRILALLPAAGMLGFTVLFLGSLFTRTGVLRFTAIVAIVGGLGGLALLYLQAIEIGAWCTLCVGVDSSAIVAGAMGVWILIAKPGTPDAKDTLVGPWWGVYWLAAFAPLVWAYAFPDPAVPPAMRELYDPDADLNVIEIADFECPYCRGMHPALRTVLEQSDANVHLVRVMAPLSFHTHARDGARAYFCAERQGRADAMADQLFAMPVEELTPEGTTAIATDLGLDTDAFAQCLHDPAIETRIDEDIARAGPVGLPTVYIGERHMVGFDETAGPTPYRQAVEAQLGGEGRRERWWALFALAGVSLLTFLLGFQYWRRGSSLTKPKAPQV